MVKTHILNAQRWSPRALGRLALPVVAALVFSTTIVQLWSHETSGLTFTTAERHGVAYLQPLTNLLEKLIDAQSTAVSGQIVDVPGVKAAVGAVDRADQSYGKELDTHRRWSDIRDRIDQLMNKRPTNESGYTAYTDAVKLIRDLILKVGDTSNLVLDSSLDSYYLIDAAVVRVPGILTFTGRATDLAQLSAAAQAEKPDKAAAAEAQQRISVARYQVAVEKDAIDAALGKAIEATDSGTLGPNITRRLDKFEKAVKGFVPPVTLLETIDTVDATKLTEAAVAVRQATQELAGTILTELDGLLRARADGLSTARSQSLLLGMLSLLFIAGVLWLLVTASRRLENTTGTAGEPQADQAQLAAADKESSSEEDNLVDLGDNRADEELVHVGRGIRARRRERVDDVR